MKTFRINKNDAGQRVDKFLQKASISLPYSLMYKAIRKKNIKLNRKRCEPGTFLAEGDVLDVYLPDEFFSVQKDGFLELVPDISVIFEDQNILVCDKPEGVSCHSDETQKKGTLIDNIKAYLYKKGEFCPEGENSFEPALCNRIDRNTSGLVICAKNAASLREVNRLIKERKIKKKYLAVCIGTPEKSHAVLTHYLEKDAAENRVRVFDSPKRGALSAITEYRVIKSDGKKTLLEVTLRTGRTHQIRAQMAHIGHPLAGDSKYGKDKDNAVFSHQALRADSVEFLPEEGTLLYYLAGKVIKAPEDKRFSV